MCPSHNILHACVISRVHLFAIPQTVAHQAPLSMGFSRQEYWNGLPFLPPGDLPNLGIKPTSLGRGQECTGRQFFTTWATGEVLLTSHISLDAISGSTGDVNLGHLVMLVYASQVSPWKITIRPSLSVRIRVTKVLSMRGIQVHLLEMEIYRICGYIHKLKSLE